MFGLGTLEIVMILLIVLIVFGAKRLPQLGRGMGQGIKDFKSALSDEEAAAAPTEALKEAATESVSEASVETLVEAEEAPAGK